jgi:hypothetical protein
VTNQSVQAVNGSHQIIFCNWQGHKEIVELLISAGASLSVVDEEVIEPSINLRN